MENKNINAEPEMVGTLDRFNNAKRAEEHDRVKHSVSDTLEVL